MVFRTALLGRADAADIGVPSVPLGSCTATRRTDRRVRVHTRARVTPSRAGRGRLGPTGSRADGDHGWHRRTCSAPAPATSPPAPSSSPCPTRSPRAWCPPRRVPTGTGGRSWAPARSSTCTSSTTGTVTDLPFAAGRRLSRAVGVRPDAGRRGWTGGQYLAISLSAADAGRGHAHRDAGARSCPIARRPLPGGPPGPGHRFFRHAGTPRHVPPGPWQRRRSVPAARPGCPGLFLAGAWTDTGWPDTMEAPCAAGSWRPTRSSATVPIQDSPPHGFSGRPRHDPDR